MKTMVVVMETRQGYAKVGKKTMETREHCHVAMETKLPARMKVMRHVSFGR